MERDDLMAGGGAPRRLGWGGVCAVLAWALLPPEVPAAEPPVGQFPYIPRIVSVTADPRTPLTRFYTLLEPFADRDVSTGTEWQVEDQPAAEIADAVPRIVYRSAAAAPPGAPPDLLLLPPGVLVPERKYVVQVRYRDARGNWSSWSRPTPLRLPPTAAALHRNPGGTRLISFFADVGAAEPMGELRASDLADVHRPDGAFPYGLAVLCINDLDPGATVSVTYTLPARPSDGSRWVHHHPGTGLVDRTPLARVRGATVTETLTDGGDGDADGVDNGTIIATVGLLVPGAAD